jgi:hypothetical protein
VKTPLERIRWVMKERGWNESQWAKAAQLKERSNLNKLIKRLIARPGEVPGDIKTFVKLADAANVSLDWLLLGRGTPDVDGATTVLDDSKYPTRSRVVLIGRLLDFPDAAIDAVIKFDAGDADPGRDFWLQLLLGKRAEFSIVRPPPEPSEPPQLGH